MPLDLVVALNEHRPTALGLCGNIMNTVIPALLQARAGKLACVIIADAGYEKGLDFGPFLLWWEGYPVWGPGLPAEGIADAHDRIERERRLWLDVKTGEWCDDTGWIIDKAKYDAGMKEIWCDFGSIWLTEEHARTADGWSEYPSRA